MTDLTAVILKGESLQFPGSIADDDDDDDETLKELTPDNRNCNSSPSSNLTLIYLNVFNDWRNLWCTTWRSYHKLDWMAMVSMRIFIMHEIWS